MLFLVALWLSSTYMQATPNGLLQCCFVGVIDSLTTIVDKSNSGYKRAPE